MAIIASSELCLRHHFQKPVESFELFQLEYHQVFDKLDAIPLFNFFCHCNEICWKIKITTNTCYAPALNALQKKKEMIQWLEKLYDYT